jgi:hypothetical protein
LQGNSRKDALRVSQEFIVIHPSQAQRCKIVNTFERLHFEKTALGCPAHKGLTRKLFPYDLFHCDQLYRYLEAASAWSKQIQPLIKLAADCGIIHVMPILQVCKMHKMLGSKKLPFRFQRNAWETRQYVATSESLQLASKRAMHKAIRVNSEAPVEIPGS